MSRPEHQSPPEIFYNDTEARKYTANSRVSSIQASMSERAIELLALPPEQACLILDIGCGSGLSGEVLEEMGHYWVGMDISPSMLEVAVERETEGDLFLQDIGQGLSFRPGCFDGAISISVIQWLCNADKQSHVPKNRLLRFFSTLYSSLTRGARAVFQFYPENADQVEMIVSSAMRAGFTGGLVVDYPNSAKAKKYFLCLFAGSSGDGPQPLPKGMDEGMELGGETVEFSGDSRVHRTRDSRRKDRKSGKGKSWLLGKKQRDRLKGKEDVPLDSKYTGRKRKPRF